MLISKQQAISQKHAAVGVGGGGGLSFFSVSKAVFTASQPINQSTQPHSPPAPNPQSTLKAYWNNVTGTDERAKILIYLQCPNASFWGGGGSHIMLIKATSL